MLRYLRLPRAALTPIKPFRSLRGFNDQSVRTQRVTIRQGSRFRRFLVGVGVTYFCYRLYTGTALAPLARYLDQLDEEQEREAESQRRHIGGARPSGGGETCRSRDRVEVEEEEDGDEPLFVPFPFTTQQVEPEPYSGKDPEWQEFIRLSKDKELLKRIQKELAQLVCTVAERSPGVLMKTGKDLKIRRWWLDVDFPYTPPPEFIRMGLDIHDAGVDLVYRTVDTKTVSLLDRMLYPSPVAASMWGFSSALLKQNLSDMMRMLGFEQRTPPTTVPINPVIQKTIERLRQSATKNPDAADGPNPLVTGQIPGDSPAMPSADGADALPQSSRSPPRPDKRPSSYAEVDGHVPTARDMIPHAIMTSITKTPLQEFKRTLSEAWKRSPAEWPPRGCILVSGFVELETKQALVVVDVFAWWNPKTRRYDPRSMRLALRRMQQREQRPLAR